MSDDRGRGRMVALSLILVVGIGASGVATAADAPVSAGRFDLVRLAVDDGGLPAAGFVSGVSIDPTWALGVGIEYDRYDEADTVPLFLHLRVTPKGGAIGHLVFVEAGYSLFWIDDTPGTDGSGPFVRGGMGRRVGRLFGSEIHACVSYRIQVSDAYAERIGRESSALTEFALVLEARLSGGSGQGSTHK